MAICLKLHCEQCKQDTKVWVGAGKPRPSVCESCQSANRAQAKIDYLAALKKLPLIDRLDKLEEWMYDHQQVRHGYTEPVRY